MSAGLPGDGFGPWDIRACPVCGDDAETPAPFAGPAEPDYGEFVCPNGHAHKPAQSVVSEPDEAAVQAVADAIAAHFFPRWGWSEMRESFQVGYRKLASAVLATPVVADAFAAVEFRKRVAEILEARKHNDRAFADGATVLAIRDLLTEEA